MDAQEIGRHDHSHLDIFYYQTYLLKCPACDQAIIGQTEQGVRDGELFWPEVSRVFPNPKKELGASVPKIVAASIDEADRCIKAGAYMAAAVMCGRALEAICGHFNTKGSYLGPGLKELRDKGIIDSRLYEWSNELREQRNNAAHANEKQISSQDADDLLTFTYAIIEYIFFLTVKFERFQSRKKKSA